eukprot:TRINITY_DN31603_c0_g1_i1.p1 TRINITY_DN31603_c0_g1~~TRINITY_DN31603_c0_g1_i1.p1  ORF type:complete len:280 (-),score=49.11 TRINITY_DN31603_c0_g1_i1:307-1146(-)
MHPTPHGRSSPAGQSPMDETWQFDRNGNPFESTFHLLRALRDEIQDLKTEVEAVKAAKLDRFKRLEDKVEDLRKATSSRFQANEGTADKVRADMSAGFDHVSTRLEDLRAAKRLRLERLEAALTDEVSDRLTAVQALDKKIRVETTQLRSKAEATSYEFGTHKQRYEADLTADRAAHIQLRQHVERLAETLAENSMARDPFKDLGYLSPSNLCSPTPPLAASPTYSSRGGGGAALATLSTPPSKFTLPRMTPPPATNASDPWNSRNDTKEQPPEGYENW